MNEKLAALERSGRAAFPAFHLHELAATTSTQDVVRAAARAGAAPGFCCLAGSQSAGRGRQDRAWVTPPGAAMLASVLVRVDRARMSAAPIAAGLAVRAAVAAVAGCDARLKWPNDVLVGARKLAGILCEAEPAAAGVDAAVVVGVGVNLSVASYPAGVAGISLHEVMTSPPSPAQMLAAVLPELARRLEVLERSGMAGLREEWLSHASGIGSTVVAESSAGRVTGVVAGIDVDGALLLRGEHGIFRVMAGDVHILGSQPA